MKLVMMKCAALLSVMYATSMIGCAPKSGDDRADAVKDSAAIAQARANPVAAPLPAVSTSDTSSAGSSSAAGPGTAATTGAPPSGTPSAASASTSSSSATQHADTGSNADAAILARTAAMYKTVQTMRADFTMRVENPLLRTTSNSSGKLYQKRPDKIALRFTQPAGDIILSDGTYFWVYTPSSLPKDQVLRTPVASAGNGGLDLRQVDLQQQFVGDPVKRFQFTRAGSESVDGRIADIFTLVPREAAPYQKLKVWIDRGDALVRRFEMTEQSGVIRHIQLNNLQINTAVDASVFRYAPPAGVRVVGQ